MTIRRYIVEDIRGKSHAEEDEIVYKAKPSTAPGKTQVLSFKKMVGIIFSPPLSNNILFFILSVVLPSQKLYALLHLHFKFENFACLLITTE